MEAEKKTAQAALSRPVSLSAKETVSGFETTDLTIEVNSANVPAVISPGRRRREPRQGTRSRRKATNAIEIDVDGAVAQPNDSKGGKIRKGIPSWLMSMILHFSLLTSLALVSMSGHGRSVIDLIASSENSVDLSNPTEVDFKIETPKETNETAEFDLFHHELTQSEELAAVLEESVVATVSESTNHELFESLASSGLDDVALPRQDAGGVGANFFGISGAGSRFVFVVDCSGSMDDFGRWKQAKKELRASINGLGETQSFLILLYNNGFIGMNRDLELVLSTARERRKAFRWLNRNHPDSRTYCADALQKALSLRPDAVFLLSDGEFNDINDVFIVLDQMNDKARLQRLNRNQTPVHTIALGSHLGTFAMKQIAAENSVFLS